MGKFCLPVDKTIEADIKAAICNLKIILEDLEHNRKPSDHLFDFAEYAIDDARKKIK